jgi:bacterioferritin-associated ferredoxin
MAATDPKVFDLLNQFIQMVVLRDDAEIPSRAGVLYETCLLLSREVLKLRSANCQMAQDAIEHEMQELFKLGLMHEKKIREAMRRVAVVASESAERNTLAKCASICEMKAAELLAARYPDEATVPVHQRMAVNNHLQVASAMVSTVADLIREQTGAGQ